MQGPYLEVSTLNQKQKVGRFWLEFDMELDHLLKKDTKPVIILFCIATSVWS